MTGKATTIAHPIQGLIKYHGLKDEGLRQPFHDSISVCTGPISTRTTVEVQGGLDANLVIINEKQAAGRELERAAAVLDRVRALGGTSEFFRVETSNDFPTNVGLGASSSGFAALAHAARRAPAAHAYLVALI